ncbi:MAG: prenyltransferase [Candidatus Omnitrophica bacterium]|nr:prenyltransferase [Candidatus Omnitrophota bacterium]
MLKNIIRALRLPFITASILPFIFGSLISRQNFNLAGFAGGFFAVIFTHLSANLINDYFDSQSGADWQDRNFYGFFGGSKLIQDNLLPEKFYLGVALFCAGLAFICVILLSAILKSGFVLLIYLLIIVLSWQYTAGPLKFSYNYLGEFFIFLLFGPALVMGGYFIQTGIFPDLKSFLMSLPFGFFTAAILFANEVPDFQGDKNSGKHNLVSLCGVKRAFIFYYVLVALGLLAIFFCVSLRYLSGIYTLSFLLIILALKAGNILRSDYSDKIKLIRSSRLTINMQMLASIILILGLL